MNKPYDTIQYKGMTINVYTMENPSNPFKEWDGNLPLMYKSGRNNGEDYSNGNIMNFLAYRSMSDNQIIRHQKRIAEIFWDDFNFDREDYDTPQDLIDELRDEIYTSKDYDVLEQFCKLAKVPALHTNSTGYSQGDWADIFTCWTPEFEAEMGCTQKMIDDKQLKGAAKLWGDWAWNNVFGYVIDDDGDSCWGFYGTNHEDSGLLECAKDAIDHEGQSRKEVRAKRLKQLIQAKVPYAIRKREMEKLPEFVNA